MKWPKINKKIGQNRYIFASALASSAVLLYTQVCSASPGVESAGNSTLKKQLVVVKKQQELTSQEKASTTDNSDDSIDTINTTKVLAETAADKAETIKLSQWQAMSASKQNANLLWPQKISQQPTTQSSELQRLQQQYLLPEPPITQVPTLGGAAAPGSSAASPTAFGASWGQAYTGIGFQARTRYTEEADGSISIGMGFGDTRKTVGAEVTVSVLSLFGDDSFERGSINFKVHRLLPEDFAVAVGVENAIIWGDSDAGSSVYGVVSKIFRIKQSPKEPFSQVTLSLGLGGGRFRSENDIENNRDSVNVFGSVGVRVAEPVSLIADWTGQDLTLGASIVPFPNVPLVITPAITDITGNAGDGTRFILGIGYSYSFTQGR